MRTVEASKTKQLRNWWEPRSSSPTKFKLRVCLLLFQLQQFSMIHWFKLINLIKNHARSQVTLEVLMISSARKTNTKLWCSILNTASMSWTAQQHIRIQVMEGLWLTSSQGSEGKKTEKTRTSKPILTVPTDRDSSPPCPGEKHKKNDNRHPPS